MSNPYIILYPKDKEKSELIFSGTLDPDTRIVEIEMPEDTIRVNINFTTKKSIETNKIVKIVAANLEDLEQKIIRKE